MSTQKFNTNSNAENNNSSDPHMTRLARLTPRENDVLNSLMQGNTIKQTAELLGIGYCTANTHITSIYKKLEVNSRAKLILQYGNLVNK